MDRPVAIRPVGSAWFDPHLLGRVLRHLLENAAGHTPPGSRVKLSCERSDDRLEFCVEDNGPGIDAARHAADLREVLPG